MPASDPPKRFLVSSGELPIEPSLRANVQWQVGHVKAIGRRFRGERRVGGHADRQQGNERSTNGQGARGQLHCRASREWASSGGGWPARGRSGRTVTETAQDEGISRAYERGPSGCMCNVSAATSIGTNAVGAEA